LQVPLFGSNVKPKNEEEYAIDVKNVSKSFRIPHEKRTTVYANLVGKITGNSYSYETFDALKDVSFKVKKGETFGIIGRNGSGKSTLLKILASVLIPDRGSIVVKNKIAPFLELGVGFQPDLTAIENVFLYGAIMGIKHSEMNAKVVGIFEFSELEKFKDTKLKNFSSGMYARLAFSTAISTDPDVLLIDEALSVGDEAFQRKCTEWIESVRRKGKTIVIVSHDITSIETLCSRCLLLNNGKVTCIGDTAYVVREYHKIMKTPLNETENTHIVSSNNDSGILKTEEIKGPLEAAKRLETMETTEAKELIETNNCVQQIDDLQSLEKSETKELSYNDLLVSNVHIGEYTYGNPQVFIWTEKYHVHIGKFTSIDSEVKIIVDGNHHTDWISGYPFGELIHDIPKNPGHPIGKGDILIGNDVWIGYDSVILPGVKIGDGAVIGAGSIVTKNVGDYEIVAGNPAKHIRYRFSKEKIEILKKIKWWEWPIETIKKNVNVLQSDEIDFFIAKFET
jgi:ABC-type polysaccharide/polyol phosphate transport system ATPase subunit/acetyltransferase-like isoleucine patch superfamily enzyme